MDSRIQKDIAELVDEQVISREIALNIEAYYHSKQDKSPSRLFTVFGVLGALLVGLGIILMLAHNWDHFSRITKTILGFLPLIIGQFLVGLAILKKKSGVWKEASGTFLFFAIGACMALVSQVYNISGDLSSYLLTWVILALPLVYLLRSHALGVLHIVFITYYALSHGYSFLSTVENPWIYWALLILFLPHYWSLLKHKANANITSVFNWLLPLSVCLVLGTFLNFSGSISFVTYVIWFGLLYNIGKLPFFEKQKLRQNGYVVLGSFGTMSMLLFSSFKIFWNDFFNKEIFLFKDLYWSIVLFTIALGLIVYVHIKKKIITFNLNRYTFILFAAIYAIGLLYPFFAVVLINGLLLILGVITVRIGAEKYHFGILNYGLIIIAILISCRFFDTNISFIIKGLLFIGVGVAFFLTNYIILKKQKK